MDINSNTIKAKAENLGFDFFNITPLDQTPHFVNFYNWLGKDQFSQLDFLNKEYVIESRRDPRRLLESSRSMIVLGVYYGSYRTSIKEPSNRTGRIAAYAHFEDYHSIIRQKGTKFMAALNDGREKKIKYKIFIDSGPVMEKDFAFAAGLGWIGKNSLLIHPHFGSFTFLCCIATDIPFNQTAIPCEDLCRDCQRCVDACPTHCISGDHTINASHCISYLTIEHKGIISHDFRGQIGNWVFGCDVCQDVCPRNFKIDIPKSKSFFRMEQKISDTHDLLKELMLTESAYLDKYKNTPIRRIPFDQFQRNCIIAAGNSHDDIFMDVLLKFLSNDSEIIRATAVWAIGEVSNTKCSEILITQLQTENNDAVRAEITDTLAKYH